MSEKEKMLSGDWHDANFDETLLRERRNAELLCYDFNMSKPSTPELVKWQLDFYYEQMKNGTAEGIVFHTNAMADMDFEAYDVACTWLDEHGDEELPDID